MSPPRRVVGPNPPGRLPAAMLRALAAELSDPGRFGRAKAYARDGAVFDVEVLPGEVRATIQGSRYEPYVTSVLVAPAEEGDHSLLGLLPDREELAADCSCPDEGGFAGGFCKHALATLLVLADEVTVEPDLLARWRSDDDDELEHRPSTRPADAPAVDILAAALVAPVPIPEVPRLPPRLPMSLAPAREAHGHEVAAALAGAMAVLRSR